jgi:hypothetical protein
MLVLLRPYVCAILDPWGKNKEPTLPVLRRSAPAALLPSFQWPHSPGTSLSKASFSGVSLLKTLGRPEIARQLHIPWTGREVAVATRRFLSFTILRQMPPWILSCYVARFSVYLPTWPWTLSCLSRFQSLSFFLQLVNRSSRIRFCGAWHLHLIFANLPTYLPYLQLRFAHRMLFPPRQTSLLDDHMWEKVNTDWTHTVALQTTQ